MLGCEILFGVERGAEVRAVFEEAMGQQCPCTNGLACPLMPKPAVESVQFGLRPATEHLGGRVGCGSLNVGQEMPVGVDGRRDLLVT